MTYSIWEINSIEKYAPHITRKMALMFYLMTEKSFSIRIPQAGDTDDDFSIELSLVDEKKNTAKGYGSTIQKYKELKEDRLQKLKEL